MEEGRSRSLHQDTSANAFVIKSLDLDETFEGGSMKTSESIALQRLLERRETTSLLQALAAQDIRLALIRADGSIFSITDNWSDGDLSGFKNMPELVGAPTGQVVHANGYRFYPLFANGSLIGALVGHGFSPREDFPLEHALHQTLQILIAQSQGKRDIASEALERYREINLMYRVGETIGVSLDPDAIPQMILEEGHRVIRADAGLVLLSTKTNEVRWETRASFGAQEQTAALNHVVLDPEVFAALGERPAILTELPAASMYGTLLWAPLKTQNQVLGGILLARQVEQEIFTASDEKLLTALARQAAVAIENSQLHQAALERERLKHELQLAHDVQASLIPREVPQIRGWQCAAYWQPAREVGGDFFDFIARDDGDFGFVIADVSDKGMHAALFMALTRSTLRASTLAAPTPADGLNQANRLLCADSTGGMFVTLFYGQIDPAASRMTYVNAGHNPPLLYRAAKKELTELTRTGIVVGFDEAQAYKQRAVRLQRDDFILFYTDGVTESVNAENEQFGEERLRRVILKHRHKSPDEIMRALKQSLGEFTGDIPAFDDVTIVIIKRVSKR
jgi:serine phosphatase RsbU (regulator of sigma subunit)